MRANFKYVFWCLAGFFAINTAIAQDVKFGKISKEELNQKFCENDSSATAMVLYRKVNIKYNYVQTDGFHVVTHVHERVKIFNKNGFDHATITESLYQGKSDEETMGGLKAYTYNLENGEVVKTKLKGSDTFTTEVNKYYKQEKFTMPNIKEGSVIEYQYRIDSPFSYHIDEVDLQYDIPIKYQEVSVAIPEYFAFSPHMKGYLSVSPERETIRSKINFTTKSREEYGGGVRTDYENSSVDYNIYKTAYLMADVPALEEEPFVNDMDNYRSAINYELQYVQFPRSLRKDYSTTWEKVIKTIYESNYFGEQLTQKRYFKDDLAKLVAGAGSEAEKAAAIFKFVQGRMAWNGLLGYYTDKGVKEAYKEKSGNTADINLMLVAMLREAGLNANPMLISTRDNGVPLLPTREGFNYVAAALELEGNTIFLDASNKFTKPNLLPTRALNWQGKIIKKDGSYQSVSVFPKTTSKEASMMRINLNPDDGSIAGKSRKTYSDYRAYMFRNKYGSLDDEEYLEKLENSVGGIEVSNYKITNKNILGKAVQEEFDFYMEDQVEVAGNKIYFSPLFYNTISENPFKLEERKYPVDFAYPWRENYLYTIAIPEGYEVTFLPKGTKMALQDNLGSFIYRIAQQGNNLQVMVDLKINQAVIPAFSYSAIKELYKKVIEKETEKVVLSKI